MKKKYSQFNKVVIAGFVAITANTIMLKLALILDVNAESGGLLKLLLMHTRVITNSYFLSFLHSVLFWFLFHYMVGFGMVALYVFVLRKILPGKGFIKGSLFSMIPWVMNSCVVLPLLGQGFMGMRQLSTTGIVYFFIANWLFGCVLGWIYEKLDIQ